MTGPFEPWQPWAFLAWVLRPNGDIDAVAIDTYGDTVGSCRATMRIVAALSIGSCPGMRMIVNDDE